jgi:Bacterial antitoxin of type II TA system, VapB
MVSPLDEILGIWGSGFMKTTLEIDDELYREAKALASLTGRKMKDLVTEGLRLALQPVPQSATKTGAARKLAACFAEADKIMASAPLGPIACEHLSKGRNRLDAI